MNLQRPTTGGARPGLRPPRSFPSSPLVSTAGAVTEEGSAVVAGVGGADALGGCGGLGGGGGSTAGTDGGAGGACPAASEALSQGLLLFR